MRRSSDRTKATILAAARERFAAAGFDGTTIRAVAADAGIDPAMVMRYFGNKDKLFAAAAEFDLRFPDLSRVDRDHLGEALVSHFLDRWEGDEALVVLLRSSATNEGAARRMREIFVSQLEPMVAAVSSTPGRTRRPTDTALRAGLVATQILGMALSRYVLRLPPVVDMTHEEIIRWLGPTIQRYLRC
jgi:AcrR family transcriptional regulator